jgi:hypothetical protein
VTRHRRDERDASFPAKQSRTARARLVSAITCTAISLLSAGSAVACSICRCGDPTFNALGLTGVPLSSVRVALDWDRLEKSQGSESSGDFETATEERVTALLGYSFSEDWTLFARLPRVQRDLTELEDGEREVTDTSGMADPEIYAQRRLWSSTLDAAVGVRNNVYAVFGVKTPWGENDLERDGARLDEHAQPGSGSTDWYGGLSGSHLLDRKSALFASVQYRATGANDFGYEYGNVVLANLAYERKVSSRWDAVVEANYRHAGRDRVADGGKDPNTGGALLYLTPRVLMSFGPRWVLRASVQVPAWERLNGEQDEKAVYDLGVTYLLKPSHE